ncbi:hypothetical protein D3C86_1771560 [compost metagenome]
MAFDSIKTASHQLTGPGVFIDAIADESLVQLGGGNTGWHLRHGLGDDVLPVKELGEPASAPLAPAIDLAGNEWFF